MQRHLAFGFELKGLTEAGEFEGYGSTFHNVDSQRDIVMPGAFKATLSKHEELKTWPAMLFQHDVRNPIGDWLELREDERGLYARGRLWIDGAHPDAWAMKMYRAMRSARGTVGLSIGFSTVDSATRKDGVRLLKRVDLYEVSPVLFPANSEARVHAVKAGIVTIRDFEAALRDALGYSHREAKTIAARGFMALHADAAREEPAGSDADDHGGAREERSEVDVSGLSAAMAELRRIINSSSRK